MSEEIKSTNNNVITRYPPSPTGLLHVGALRTALFNYLYAKKNEGKIILRWEDTDKQRSKKEFEQEMFENLKWAGITFDAVYHQSERSLIYRKHLEKMLADGTAFYSETSTASEFNQNTEEDEDEEENKTEEGVRVIRLKNPNKDITFIDSVRGEITVNTTELGDFIIARSIEEPLYHFAVVVDDFEMGITHVIRGEDGIYNTPRQILIAEAIGAPRPLYCHIPFVLSKERKKLSKRHGSKSVAEYRQMGILPEALINYLALLGWNPGTEQEIFTIDELIKTFDLDKIQKSGAIFDDEKLKWVNREHIKKLSDETFRKLISQWVPQTFKNIDGWNEEIFNKITPHIKERVTILSDIKEICESGEINFFFSLSSYETELIFPKGNNAIKDENELREILETTKSLLLSVEPENWSTEKIKESVWSFAEEKGRGNVLWPLRVSLSGLPKSQDPFTIASVIGKDETIKRLDKAIERLI